MFKINNPYEGVMHLIENSERHYKTNLHTHSTYSDANETHTLKAVEPTFYVDGKKVNETAFRDAYTKIISPTILGEVSGNVGTQLCSLTFNYNTDTSSETIVFYEYRDLYAAVAIDGRTQFYVNRSSVKDMMNAINKLSE